jgi:hypothetical protein
MLFKSLSIVMLSFVYTLFVTVFVPSWCQVEEAREKGIEFEFQPDHKVICLYNDLKFKFWYFNL